MATLVLTAVATAIAGPIAGVVASIAGFAPVSGLFGSKRRQGPRLGELAVQSSAYGQPIPRLYGRVRASGSVIWATDIEETAQTSGGGKGRPKTTSYSYAASFAVALSDRPIRGVRRIWADGKLIRGESGNWIVPAAMRLYTGTEDQAIDPLIASVEGIGNAPAYRGIAYAVFEDLQLAEFANHIPSLSFEIEADPNETSVHAVLIDLNAEAGMEAAISGGDQLLYGLGISGGGSFRDSIEMLDHINPIRLIDGVDGLEITTTGPAASAVLPAHDLGARGGHEARRRDEPTLFVDRTSSDQLPAEVSIIYYERDRDYQPGLQRSRRAGGGLDQRLELPAALDAGQAKTLADRRLAQSWSRRATAKIRVPWRWCCLRPGDLIDLPGQSGNWRVHEWTFDRTGIELALEGDGAASGQIALEAEAGRSIVQSSLAQGPTVSSVMDIPPLFDEASGTPSLWVAVAGSGAVWRRADLSISLDQGASWHSFATANAASVMGVADTLLPPGASVVQDRRNSIDVSLLGDGMWLEGRSWASLLAGANIALLGDELIQFEQAEALGGRRFRLSGLLRGRRATEWAMDTHQIGERFVLIEPARLARFDPPVGSIGGRLLFRAAGPGEDPGAVAVEQVLFAGRALLPPSPVHLSARRQPNGDLHLAWIRRSRAGWNWIDGVDAPLGEEAEHYRLTIAPLAGAARTVEPGSPNYSYIASEQIADAGQLVQDFSVSLCQFSTVAGAGRQATRTFTIPV